MNLLFFLSGTLLGALLYKIYLSVKKSSIQDLSRQCLKQAEIEAEQYKERASKSVLESEQKLAADHAERQAKIRVKEKELESDKSRLQAKFAEFEKKEKALADKLQATSRLQNEAEKRSMLIHDELVKVVEKECAHELVEKYRHAEELAKIRASQLVVDAIARVNPPRESCRIVLANDDIKAKIIGRQGKNCKAFKEITGVDIVIDDTLEIQLSSFDLERREIAKIALEDLIDDGRINPTLIQEAVDRAKLRLATVWQRYGQEAANACKVIDLHPELLQLVGKMALRRTVQQNLLEHSIEVSHLMWMVAEELGLNGVLARRIGLLHDIGKVVSVESGPQHALVGQKLALQFGESEEVANGIGAHHGQIEPLTLEARLCAPCDSLSATRPGARSENSQKYFERIEALEKEAMSFDGVEKAFVYQGGKELRVFVRPDVIDELQAGRLAHAISRKIHESTAGHVEVIVVREVSIGVSR